MSRDIGLNVNQSAALGAASPFMKLFTVLSCAISHGGIRRQQQRRPGIDSGYLFVSTTGAPLHERNVSEAFHLLCDQAKVPRIRFHDTRHCCGTLLHVQGADVFVIKEVLGHSPLSTTKRYKHVPIQVTRAALDGLERMFLGAKQSPIDDLATVKTTVKPETKSS